MSTRVYQFSGFDWPHGDQTWYAVTESGEVLASHVSSGRGWGIRDTGPTGFYRDKYPEDAEVIVCDRGAFPPAHVLDAAGFEEKSSHGAA